VSTNPNARFDNFEDVISFTTIASSNNLYDVILLDGGIGVLGNASTAAGTAVPMKIRGAVRNLTKGSGTAWSQGAQLFWDPVNLVLTNVPTLYPAGTAIETHVSADVLAGVILSQRGRGGLIGAAAQATALTGSSEAVAATINIPANLLISGDQIQIDAAIGATAQNSTDTLRVRIRIGGLTGTVVADTGAVQCAANTAAIVSAKLQAGAISATVGTMYGAGLGVATATANAILASVTSLNNTAAIAVVVTYVWSSSSAGDTGNLEYFTVQRLGG
jgi:hypothetical protein